MINVELKHNPFTQISQVQFDGKSYQASSMSKYLNLPFVQWFDKIVDCIALEANDEFMLSFVGYAPFARLVGYYAKKNTSCVGFAMVNPNLNDGTKNRLNKLSMLMQNGLIISRVVKELIINTDLETDFVTNIKSILPKYPFCKISVLQKNEDQVMQNDGNGIAFVVSRGEPGFANKNDNGYWFQLADDIGFCGIKNGFIWEKTDNESLLKLLETYIEISILIPILREITQVTKLDKSAASYNAFSLLDKIDPLILINIPSSIELDSSAQVKVTVLPNTSNVGEFTFKSINQAVIRVSGDIITAINSGETVIEVFQNKQLIGRYPVRSYKRIKAKNIAFYPANISLAIGDTIKALIESEPLNADNVGLSAISISNRDVVSVSRTESNEITVSAINTGFSVITARLDGLECKCIVKASPRLEHLPLALSREIFGVGEVSRLTVSCVPKDALVGEFSVTIIPDDIARYDVGVEIIIGTKCGKGKVIVADERTGIKSFIEFCIQ